MSWTIILLPFLISIFIFLCFFNIKGIKTKSFLKRIENYTEKFSSNSKRKLYYNLGLFLRERGPIKLMWVNIETTTGLFILRIILSLTSLIVLLALGFFMGRIFYLLSVFIASILYFLPAEILRSKIKKTSKKILKEIPGSLDIISSLIKAGLNLDQSIGYYAKNYVGEISQLFKIANTKIIEGKSRKEAYHSISELSFCNEFKTVIKIIIQSDFVGNPINKVFKDLSKILKKNYQDQIKIKAEKLESKLILIIFIFMFIPMLTLFLLPIFPQLKMIFN